MCSVFFKKSNKLNNLRQKTIDLNNGLQFGTCMAITEYATPKKYSLKRDTEGNFKCCDVHYDFHIKTMFRSSLTAVCRRVRVLLTLFVFVCA